MDLITLENLSKMEVENMTNISGTKQSVPSSAADLPEVICFSFLFFVIGIIGIVGNCLVMYAVMHDKKMRASATNLLITNLAFADILIMVFGVPEIIQFMLNKGWILDVISCKANRYVLVTSLYASVLTLVAICIERYIGIIHPIKAHILCNRRRIAVVIGLIWPLSCLAGAPTLIFNQILAGHPDHTELKYCMLHFPDNPDLYFVVFKYSEFALFYMSPLVIQVTVYCIVSKQLFTGSEKLHRRLTVLDENGLAKERSSEAVQARKGVVKMLIMSVVVYFVSYSPHQVLFIYHSINPQYFHDNWTLRVFVMIIAYTNSAANPILYSIFSQNFRSSFQKAFCRLKTTKRRPNPRRQSTFSNSSRFGRMASLVHSANTDL
ncbi:neuropeptide receptor 15 [Patella vulgata]|uniref:neuropeptide receptor 15 n=1 Tax=Patella vulgata TaxID=6465 RepID=UPI00217FC3C4|nr:neuropeptide receptor 15 [Patella vulgata]